MSKRTVSESKADQAMTRIAIEDAQERENVRALAAGRPPRAITILADIPLDSRGKVL